MALRALLFSSDGMCTSALCQVLTDLVIEAEICPELLVAAQRVTQENYDAILVDWDRENEAIVLLKTAREQRKNAALNLAIVQNDKDLPRALQHGANSVIRKPVDPLQAHDTLSTARDLILSRQAEQEQKEARVAALRAEAAAAGEFPEDDEPASPKTGFLAQTAPRSAFEAEEMSEKAEPGTEDKTQCAQPPKPQATLHEWDEEAQARPPEKKRWDEKPQAREQLGEPEEFASPRSQDKTAIFSSFLPEQEEEEPTPEPMRRSHSQSLVFAMVGCLLVAGVLWVWAPGDSYRTWTGSVRNGISKLTNPRPSESSGPSEVVVSEKPVTPPAAKPEDPASDLDSVDTAEVDTSKIQIIETKAIPRPGAQQPPTTEPPPDSDQTQPPASTPQPASTPEPLSESLAPQPPQPQTQLQPAVIPVARPQTPAVSATGNPPSASQGRTGVIIPDSLRNTPSAAPASSLELTTVPEETSRDLLIHKVDPEYPAQALRQRLEGAVILQVWVAKDGTIQDLKLLKGYFALARAASDAVKQWRFKPYTPNGTPITFQTTITLTFKYPG